MKQVFLLLSYVLRTGLGGKEISGSMDVDIRQHASDDDITKIAVRLSRELIRLNSKIE